MGLTSEKTTQAAGRAGWVCAINTLVAFLDRPALTRNVLTRSESPRFKRLPSAPRAGRRAHDVRSSRTFQSVFGFLVLMADGVHSGDWSERVPSALEAGVFHHLKVCQE